MMQSELNVYSIISKNYYAHLKVTNASLKNYRTGLRHHVLLLDDSFDFFTDEDRKNFVFYRPEQFCDPKKLLMLYKEYSLFELSCIFKAKFARFLFTELNCHNLFYLDTDLFFMSHIEEAEEALASSNAVLTPHTLKPRIQITRDEVFSEAIQLATGLFNMGFFGLRNSPEANKFLDWWDIRTETHCRRNLGLGIFDDQAWIDSAPILFERFSILKHPGYNVANWNLAERIFTKSSDKYYINGERLVFVHFSQAKVQQEKFLTGYREILLEDFPLLREIYLQYKDNLVQSGFQQISKWPFSKSMDVPRIDLWSSFTELR